MIDGVIERLAALRNSDGGWGPTADRPSSTEPTALALIAHAATGGVDEPVRAASDWLLANQSEEGSWSVFTGLEGRSWTTALALMAIQKRTGSEQAVDRGLQWLARSHGAVVPWRTRFRDWLRGTQTVELDLSLTGWSWAPDTFSWVEPTAWSILALRNGYDQPPRAVADRIEEGTRLILDRSCPGGGWNYGNKVVLGVDIEPYPDTTAIALLALAGTRDGRIDEGLAALERMVTTVQSGLTLSLTSLCWRAYRRDTADINDRLARAFEQTGFLDDVRTLALSAMAVASAPIPLVIANA